MPCRTRECSNATKVLRMILKEIIKMKTMFLDSTRVDLLKSSWKTDIRNKTHWILIYLVLERKPAEIRMKWPVYKRKSFVMSIIAVIGKAFKNSSKISDLMSFGRLRKCLMIPCWKVIRFFRQSLLMLFITIWNKGKYKYIVQTSPDHGV